MDSKPAGTDKWRPTCSPAMLQLRAAMLRQIRGFFDSSGYLEVETPLLSSDIVVDAHIDAFEVRPSLTTGSSFLQTSPEAAMKRLLAAEVGSVYQVTRSFRPGEMGPLHNPEFSIVEWYGIDSTDRDQIGLTSELVRSVASVIEPTSARRQLVERPFRLLPYDDAFFERLGFRVLDLSGAELTDRVQSEDLLPDVAELPQQKDDLLNLLLAEYVEPHLGFEQPVFLTEYPASQAALAEVSKTDSRVAHRFELYVRGIELCNGYRELMDADLLLKREQQQNDVRVSHGRDALPGAPRLRGAMREGLPACSGVALGFDRLVMVLSEASRICDVIPFPADIA
jgi:lysyl-tRNA synthetase class 2